MKIFAAAVFCLLSLCVTAPVLAQTAAPAYKLTKISLVPFERKSGALESEIRETDDRVFFNEISKNYLVTVEISGAVGSFEVGRKVEVIVTEGKKVKARKLEQIDLIGEDGKVYMPLWIDAPLCDAVTITARIVGQKTPSTLKKQFKVFECGE
jgi:hypothetical protein